jgi:hypothetical protein
MVTVYIRSWDKKKGRATLTDYPPKDLEEQLTLLTGFPEWEIKRLAKQLKHREEILLPALRDVLEASTLCSFLESLGAIVELSERRLAQQSTPMHGDYGYMTRKADAAEALVWLREAKSPDDRTITGGNGKGWRGARAIAVVQELYNLGAVKVTAVEISGRLERERRQDTSTLIMELPRESAKRTKLFKWEAKFARKEGWDPTPDWGQDYLLIWRD